MDPGATVGDVLGRIHEIAVRVETRSGGLALGDEIFFTGFEEMKNMCSEKILAMDGAEEFFTGVYYFSLEKLHSDFPDGM